MLDSVCRTGTRLRSSTLIAYFHHYVTVRLADAVSLDLFVHLLATVPAADTLLADPGMTEPVLPFTPAEIEALTDDAGALTPFLQFLGLLNNSPLKREGFDQIKTLLACGCPQTCRHPDHETLFDAVLVRSRVLRRAAGIA